MPERTIIERAEERGTRFVREDSYVLVLFLIIATIISMAFVGSGTIGLLVAAGFTSLTLIVALSTSGAGPRTKLVGRTVVIVASFTVVLADVAHYYGIARVGFFIVLVTLGLITPFVIARRLWQHPSINVNTVAGAADIYLLVGLLFASAYTLIGAIQAGHLDPNVTSSVSGVTPHSAFFYSARPTTASDFVYFSFVTLTTVGYGDLTPTSTVGRMLSNTEALLGQLYLVTVVAVLVANIGRERRQADPDRAEAAEEDRST